MKKTFFSLLIGLLLASCIGPVGPEGPEGLRGPGTNWIIKDFEVQGADWIAQLDDAGRLVDFYYAFSFPEINDEVYNDGAIHAYVEVSGRQCPLPLIEPFEDTDDSGAKFLWTRTTTFDYAVGNITFYVKNSDFHIKNSPQSMKFRVALNW